MEVGGWSAAMEDCGLKWKGIAEWLFLWQASQLLKSTLWPIISYGDLQLCLDKKKCASWAKE